MQTLPTAAIADPNRSLEEACVEEYLRAHGYTQESVRRLPTDAARSIMASTVCAAAQWLIEIECRAHWLHGVRLPALHISEASLKPICIHRGMPILTSESDGDAIILAAVGERANRNSRVIFGKNRRAIPCLRLHYWTVARVDWRQSVRGSTNS